MIADEYSTNTQMVTTLLDDVWPDHIFDLIYSSVDIGLLEPGITISEEVEAVLKTNATDTSINGTKRLVSMRNCAVGFIGQKLAPESTVEFDSHPVETHSPFFGFEQTAVTYTICLDMKSDFCTGNTVDGNMAGMFALMQPGELFSGLVSTVSLGWALFIGLGTAVLVGIITYAIRDGKNRAVIAVLLGLLIGAIAAAIYIAVTAFLSLTIV